MKKIRQFLLESYGELKKVIWPSQSSVFASAKVVMISTIILALFFGLVDFMLSTGLLGLFNLF